MLQFTAGGFAFGCAGPSCCYLSICLFLYLAISFLSISLSLTYVYLSLQSLYSPSFYPFYLSVCLSFSLIVHLFTEQQSVSRMGGDKLGHKLSLCKVLSANMDANRREF